ncbi:hypothetical protein F2Q69_00030037 [Brassica cretica]|uniref:C2H2-type domain-containing protein n=1 Tax=Brassica cretica TaxID=69181 RepID=A0A8S9S350_BRACR|nr:hypothetical protein F2Q69_00030037 [Brassica cretica]
MSTTVSLISRDKLSSASICSSVRTRLLSGAFLDASSLEPTWCDSLSHGATALGSDGAGGGAFLDASSLEPTWCDSLSHGATALGSDGAGGGIAVLLLYPRCLGKGGSCFVFVLKVIVVPSRSIASLAKGGASLSSWLVFKFDLWNLVDRFRWPVLVLFFSLIFMLSPVQSSTMLLVWRSLCLYAKSSLALLEIGWCVVECFSNGLERMSANDAAKISKIEVWWDMKDCPIPEGYDARRVRPSIERACKEIGYYGPVSITAYGDQKQTLCQHLRGLSSTGAVSCEGVAVAHSISEATCALMYRDMVEWRGQNPPPATMIIISDQVEVKSCKDTFLLYYANWRWKQLLEKGGGEPLVDRLSAMFYCKSCDFDFQSLEKFRKHLSRYKHGREDFIRTRWYTQLVCVTKTWRRNYRATPEHATAKIQVWWDMDQCLIPEGYDARLVRPSIEAAFKEIGYSGPVSITAYADHKETPNHVLLALSSTGVDVAHTLHIMLTSAEWLWESLLAVSEKRNHTLQKCSESDRVVASAGLFYCKLCDWYFESFDDFNRHFSSKEHAESRIFSQEQTYEEGTPEVK